MRLPMGNFGNLEPVSGGSHVVANPGNEGLQAVEALGKTASAIGSNIVRMRDAEAERERLQKEQEARQAQERADRAATITAQIRSQNGLSDLQDTLSAGLADGSITPDVARDRWKTQSQEVVDTHLGGAPEQYRGILKAESEGWVGKGSNILEDRIRVRAQQDVGANLSAIGEELQRTARDDITGATKRFEEVMDVMGPQAGLKPEQIQTSKQKFREQTRYTQAYDLMGKAGDNIGALRAVSTRLGSDEFADVDPQRRVALETGIQSKIATLENRAAIRQESAMRQAEATFTSFSTFMDSGRMPTEAYTQQVISRVKGTPYEAAVMESIKQAPHNAAFASQPVGQQVVALQSMVSEMNQSGSSPQMEAAYRKREQIVRGTMADIEKDAISAALDRNVIAAVQPLNFADVTTLPAQLAARGDTVAKVSTWAGKTVSPLTAEEANALGRAIDPLPPTQKARALEAFARAVPQSQMLAISKQLGDKNGDLAIAAALSVRDTTEGRNVGELFLKGKEAIAQGRVKLDTNKETGVKAQIFERLQGVYSSPAATQAAADAAYAVYAQRKTEGSDKVDTAISLVTGGIKDHNGGKIAKPYGWSDDKFDDWLKTTTPATLGAERFVVNGKETSAAELSAALPGARLRAYGDGQYLVESGSDVVRLPTGAPFILKVK